MPHIFVKSNLLGEPVPGLVTTLFVAMFRIVPPTTAAEAVGLFCRYRAATPATCGLAIEVPLEMAAAVSLVFHDEVTLVPGAKRSRHEP